MARTIFSSDFVNIADLYVAYRKAKSEAFYDGMHPNALAFADYEAGLKRNLECTYRLLNKRSPNWFQDLSTIGGYVQKSVDEDKWNGVDDVHFRAVDPIKDWSQCFSASGGKRLEASYRLTITPTIDLQKSTTMLSAVGLGR